MNAPRAFSGDFSAAPITATAAHLLQVKAASFIVPKTQQSSEMPWQSPGRPDKGSAAERLLVHLRRPHHSEKGPKAQSLAHLWTSNSSLTGSFGHRVGRHWTMENLMSENEILAAVRKVREMVLQYPARRNHGASPLHYELLHPSRRPCPSLQAGAISPEGVCLAPSPIANGHVLAESNDESWLASSASSSSTHRLPSAISKMELKIGEASPLLFSMN